jgi:hypothetical protein
MISWMKEIAKAYIPADSEAEITQRWEDAEVGKAKGLLRRRPTR